MPSTAWSSGASAKTMLAALPPSSRVSRLPVPATACGDAAADLGGAGERDLVDPVVVDQRGPGLARAGDDVDDARRQVGLLADLGEQQGGQRCRLRRLQHHGVAAGQRRRDLPRQHEQREVPRDHLAGDSQRLRIRAESRVAQLVGPAGVVEEVGRGEGDVDVPALADRLAVVDRLQHGQFARSLGHDPGDPVEVLGPLGARHPGPATVGRPRGGDGGIHVLRTRLGDVGQLALGRGVHRGEVLPGCRLAHLAADEQAVAVVDRHRCCGFRRRRVGEDLAGQRIAATAADGVAYNGSVTTAPRSGASRLVLGHVVGAHVAAGAHAQGLADEVVEQAWRRRSGSTPGSASPGRRSRGP